MHFHIALFILASWVKLALPAGATDLAVGTVVMTVAITVLALVGHAGHVTLCYNGAIRAVT